MIAAWADVADWLRANGWRELPRAASGHAYFVHPPSGVKVTLRAPGRKKRETSPGEMSNVIRDIERAGFDRRAFRAALGGR